MRPGRVLLIFTVSVFAGGALVAPWLYLLTKWAASHGVVSESLTRIPFHRFVNRSLLVLALAGIWPLKRALGMRSWRDLGWIVPAGQGGHIALGFGLGFLSLAAMGLAALACGAWEIHADLRLSRLLGSLFIAALSGLAVALLEETFFRGAVMGALQRAHSAMFALALSSTIFALLHFFQRPVSPEQVRWFSGLLILPQMMRGFVDLHMLVPGFFNLTIVGFILGFAYQRAGNLYFSAALHGGWVFWLKFWGAVARMKPGENAWFWGTGKIIDGWLALGILLAVLAVVVRLRWSKVPHEDAPALDKKTC